MKMSSKVAYYYILAAAVLAVARAGPDAGEGEEVHCEGEVALDYNLNLAIASVFIMWFISFSGAAFPALLAIRRHPYLELAIKFGAFAGSGVLLATGFVHMLFSANENLSSPCLSESWLGAYPSWGTLFAVITIVVMQTLDYLLYSLLGQPSSLTASPTSLPQSPIDSSSSISLSMEKVPKVVGGSDVDAEAGECHKHVVCEDEECKGRALLPHVSGRAKIMSNLVVSEVSIGLHSIIIGLALGVTSSGDFTALFIAIIFHQLLEGVALGSSASEAGISTRGILILAGIYSLTTPLGIAIGIGVRESLNTNSAPLLLTTGILDAIAAGALIFLALGDHMNACKSQADWLRSQKIGVQMACFFSFFTGATVLLVLALWA